MPPAFTVLIGFTLLGDALQRQVHAPVPGPVLGMTLLLVVVRLLLHGGPATGFRQLGLAIMPAAVFGAPAGLLLRWPVRLRPAALAGMAVVAGMTVLAGMTGRLRPTAPAKPRPTAVLSSSGRPAAARKIFGESQ